MTKSGTKHILYKMIAVLALLTLPAMSRAQFVVTDTIRPGRIEVRSPQYGIALLNTLDTYLGGQSHTGLALHFSNEKFRDARTGSYRWKYQRILNTSLGYATQESDLQLTGLIGYSWGGYHPFKVAKGLSLLAGVQLQVEGGAIYNPSGGNNPASAKLRTALAVSGMAIYRFPVRGKNWIARYQLDFPLIGAMFAPQFGQSYYEIFGLGHAKGVVAFTHPGNAPSSRHILTMDIPLKAGRHSTTLRLSYTADINQSNINETRCHIYRNAFTLGFTRTILKIKAENRLMHYSPY